MQTIFIIGDMEHVRSLADLTARIESSQRARAIVAKAVGTALYQQNWMAQVEASCGGRTAVTELKAAVDAGTTFDPSWVGPIADMRVYSEGLLALVRPRTVIDRLAGVRRAPLNVGIPLQTGGATADWVGERKPIPVAALEFDLAPLPPSKIAVIVPYSKELARVIAAQSLIESDLTRAIVRGSDVAFLDPTRAAVPNESPASITNGATEIPSTGATAAAIEADIADLLRALSDGEAERPYVVLSPNAAITLATLRTSGVRVFPNIGPLGGDVMGVPALVSPAAANYFIGIDAAGVVVADVGMEITNSSITAIQQDSAPTAGPANMVSLFQANAIALKAIRWISWTRRDDAVAYIDLPFGSPA